MLTNEIKSSEVFVITNRAFLHSTLFYALHVQATIYATGWTMMLNRLPTPFFLSRAL